MDETNYVLRSSNVNETTFHFKTHEDPKYFYVAIASLVVFLLISILTTVLLCVTLKNEPILWEADVEKPPECGDDDELQETSVDRTRDEDNKI